MKRLIPFCLMFLGPMLWAATSLEEKTFNAQGLREVSVENINGDIEIIGVPGALAKVRAVKIADSESRLADLRIKTTLSDGRLTIKTEHVRTYLFGLIPLKTGGRVDYRIEVPPDAALTLETVNGGIKVRQAGRSVNAETVNGDLEAEDVRGTIHLESVNGNIRLLLSDSAPQATLETVNGSITMSAPDTLDARYSFETVSGDIRFTPEKFKTKGSGHKDIEGVLGSGKGKVSAETVNGTITLHLKPSPAV